ESANLDQECARRERRLRDSPRAPRLALHGGDGLGDRFLERHLLVRMRPVVDAEVFHRPVAAREALLADPSPGLRHVERVFPVLLVRLAEPDLSEALLMDVAQDQLLAIAARHDLAVRADHTEHPSLVAGKLLDR